jgi:two-component system sensor histidine kinase KdpD
LRRAAVRVDEQMRAYMQTRAIPGPWPAGERLLVCVGPSPLGERLVRATRRLAEQLNAEWFAVYVETPEHARLTDMAQGQVAATLKLSEELGAQAKTLPGESVARVVLDFARRYNVTKIVAGKPRRARWQEWLHSSPVDQLIREGGSIDVYVVSSTPEEAPPAEHLPWWRTRSTWQQYLLSTLLVAAATVLGWPIQDQIAPTNLVMLYLLAVLIAAVYLGRGPSILASLLSVLAFDFFFVNPQLNFAVSDTEYLLTFLGLLVVGLVISELAARAREQAQAALQREAQTSALYAFSRDLAAAVDLDQILHAVVRHISETFGRAAVILLPEASERRQLIQRAQSPGFMLGEQEYAVATWAYRHGQPAGRGTDTLPAAFVRYLPLKTARGAVGVLGVRPSDPNRYLTPAQRQLLEAFASQAALAIERCQLSGAVRQAEVMQVTERLQSALLNSISHDLRTPLVSITGALSSLQEDEERLAPEVRRSLVANAREEVERLNRLVGNLLDMSRLAAGALHLHPEPDDVQDLVGSALMQLGERVGNRPVDVTLPDDLPLVLVDDALMVQVLVNLVDNALKYAPPGSPIEITARCVDHQVEIAVADRGPGIPQEDLTRVFDKFYRVQHTNGRSGPNGTGLGLSICQGIVEAHGGRIWAENRPGGGAVFRLTVPLESQESREQ